MTDDNHMLQLFKEAVEKEHGRELTDREARKSFQFLAFLAEVAIDNALVETDRQKRLLENPQGFHLEGGHPCELCRTICRNESSWYDENGIKYVTCQDAINNKIISPKIHRHPECFCFGSLSFDSFLVRMQSWKSFCAEGVLTRIRFGSDTYLIRLVIVIFDS
jgi:hypothetical protein